MKQLPLDDGAASMMTPTSRLRHFSAKHVNAGCDCRTLEAPNAIIAGILRNGGIPVLRIETGSSGRLTLRAKQCDARSRYIVVQHTQLDGLASSIHGTITTCQLMQLALRMGKLQADETQHGGSGELWFWLDTLCEDRARASPPAVFERAHAVLLVDSALHALRSADDFHDLPAHLADVMAGHPRLALSPRLLLMNSYYGYVDLRARSRKQQRVPFSASDYELRRS